MILAILAILGVPLWLIIGLLVGAFWSRRRFKQQPGVFRLKIRDASDEGWPRTFAYGRAIHDVLIVNIGLALMRTNIYGIATAQVMAAIPPPFENALVLDLTLDDGSPLQIAIDAMSAAHLEAWIGPALDEERAIVQEMGGTRSAKR